MRYIKGQYRRTGTFREGRYKSCPVQDETHLLRCYRYIELNPVRAGMVADPADYRWSSYPCNGLGQADPLVRPRPRYTAIAAPDAHTAIYWRFVLDAIDPDETAAIRLNLQHQHALGNDLFRAAIERQLSRRTGSAARAGRPPKIRSPQEESAL